MSSHTEAYSRVQFGQAFHRTRALVCGALALSAIKPIADDAADRHFLDRVKPLLESRCISCHGPDKVKGGLRLDSREAALKGGESGPAISPGKPAESALLQAVLHQKKDKEMPPKEKLSPLDIAALESWIQDGAPWPKAGPADGAPVITGSEVRLGDAWTDERNPIRRLFGGQRLDLWSFQPVKSPKPPSGSGDRSFAGAANPVDRFVREKLAEKGLSGSPEADPRTLIRRLTFDLTGLPPTADEVEAFERESAEERRAAEENGKAGKREDGIAARSFSRSPSHSLSVPNTPLAYSRLVDRLLASPRYGEHQARLWLDVVRYSDSNGFDWDEFRPRAWRFRDYAIRSFNADKPFDRFIREQLAGDELVSGPPRDPAEQDALIATGFLRLGPHDNAAPLFNEQDRSRAELMADLVETTGSAFLGLTMACCRCHDHKYDPLSQADHYRLRAFFEPVTFADDLPLDVASEQSAIRQHNEGLDAEVKPLDQERESLLNAARQRLREERLARLSVDERALLDLPKEQARDDLKGRIDELRKRIEPSDKEAGAALAEPEKRRAESLENQIAAINQRRRSFSHGLLMTDAEGAPAVTRVLFQGNHKMEREPVTPGFPSAMDPNSAAIRPAPNPHTSGRRLTLAGWIASPANPLTARVFVNRVWQQHFGRGLVATPNDLGLAGARPTHPELLDWLASEFVRSGWSVKQLHRLIVTSATYRQASRRAEDGAENEKAGRRENETAGDASSSVPPSGRLANTVQDLDADNLLLWRQNPHRLSAEQLRDALLSVAGILQHQPGGPPVWPELPPDILQANPAFLDDNETRTKGWYPSAPATQCVRSVFLIQKKTVRVPFMETFDLPENSTSCARRTVSTVAPQALSLLNSPLAVEAARQFAARVRREAGDSAGTQAGHAFRLALQRSPTSDELALCLRLSRDRSLTELCRALLNLNEFAYVD